MDMNDMNELRELSQTEEVVAVLRQAEKPISTADIFEQCKSFEKPGDISRVLFSLRKKGQVVTDGEYIHPKTKKTLSLYRMATEEEATVEKILSQPKAAKPRPAKKAPRHEERPFRVALASDLTLSMNLSSGQIVNLSSDEVEQLHKYLTAVYGVLA